MPSVKTVVSGDNALFVINFPVDDIMIIYGEI